MKNRIIKIKDRIAKAALSCGRDPKTIRLIAVCKTMNADRVREAIEAGIDTLGENYIQEAKEKIETLSQFPVSWHFIGHLQSNKAKYAVRLFDLIHTVDSLKLATEIDRQARKADKIQSILIQVHQGEEATKSGVSAETLPDLVKAIGSLENISIRGLMSIPPFFDQPEQVRPYFAELRKLRDEIAAENIPNVFMDELSMGMTGDFETAIEEGATLVRIGTAIFGERH